MWERLPTKRTARAAIPLVTKALEGYAARGVFRGFSAGPAGKTKASFKLTWHYDRQMSLLLDVRAKKLRFPEVLPAVPRTSSMYRELRQFIALLHSSELPPHRRIEPKKARLTCANAKGSVSISITAVNGDFEYATRKLIHAVHEIFLTFLADGPYFEYLVEHLGLDVDRY